MLKIYNGKASILKNFFKFLKIQIEKASTLRFLIFFHRKFESVRFLNLHTFDIKYSTGQALLIALVLLIPVSHNFGIKLS